MTFTIRQFTTEESIPVLHVLSGYAFTPTPPLPDADKFADEIRHREGGEYYAALVNEQPQAIACATTPLIQNLRGVTFSMGGVADVCTHPAARRKGYVRALMHQLYARFYEQGIAVSCLYPFKEGFYQRLGYVTMPQMKRAKFNPEVLRPILNMNLPGEVELVKFTDGFPVYRAFLEEQQARTHGMALFSIPQAKSAQTRETWLAVARVDGRVVGLMQYRLKGQMMKQDLFAIDFLFSNATGKFLLLDWIARHIDQAATAEVLLKPDQVAETFFTDIQPELDRFFVPPMGRVINISALAGLPVGPGEITIRLTDPDCDWNNGIWQLSGDHGVLAVEQGEDSDCELTIQGLSALVYGVTDPDEFAFRSWGNPDQNQQTILREMFPPALPFLHANY